MADLASRIATTATCGAAAEARARQEEAGGGTAPYEVMGASAVLVLRSTHGGFQLLAAEATPTLESAGGGSSEEGEADEDEEADDDGDDTSGSGSSGGSDSGKSVLRPPFVAASTTKPRPYFRRPGSSTWVEVTLTVRREGQPPNEQHAASTPPSCAALEPRFPPSALCRWEEEVEQLLAAGLDRRSKK